MLLSEGEAMERLLAEAGRVKGQNAGEGVWLRGLIEYSNVCSLNCLYCGIRRDRAVERYTLTEEQTVAAARYAWQRGLASVVIQAGENRSAAHIAAIERIVGAIGDFSDGRMGITLSLGEQSRDTYRRWLEAGAHRYLLRIESSDRAVFAAIHPPGYSYDNRLRALHDLKELGYQLGTGVMIGLPGQSVESLAGDIAFMRDIDIDMCGMGPYLECDGTPLPLDGLRPKEWRAAMTLKMIAALRITMPDINIAATTALQAISDDLRLKALESGANVAMPNITPVELRPNYALYADKPLEIDSRIEALAAHGRGDSLHYTKKL